MVWLSSIKMSDVELLEEVFAYMTDIGWIIPDWLVTLRMQVEQRDCHESQTTDQ
jgi:hypothetical protein